MSQLNVNIIKNRIGDSGPTVSGDTTISGNTTVSGIITANSFVGDGSGLTGVGITDGDNTSANFLVTGISTFQGNANFDGNVTIGGTLTYQDVTNVDAVGMITARKGIQVLADGIQVDAGIVTSVSGFAGALTGNVTGNVNGNVTGDVTGDVTGNLIGGTIVGTSASVSGMTTTSNLVVENTVWTAITTTNTNKTIVNREYCTCVTSTASTNANITITLPASPQIGWEVGVAVAGTFLDTVVARNSSNIMALAEDMILNKEYIAVQLVYVNANVGWRFF